MAFLHCWDLSFNRQSNKINTAGLELAVKSVGQEHGQKILQTYENKHTEVASPITKAIKETVQNI